jgi:hypothetical protein
MPRKWFLIYIPIIVLFLLVCKFYIEKLDTRSNDIVFDASYKDIQKKEKTIKNHEINPLKDSSYIKYSFSDFLYKHPVSKESSISYSYELFNSGHIDDARKYSEMIILENKNSYAMEALPVLLSSYKKLNKENEFNHFISTIIYNLVIQEDESSKNKANDIASNVLNTVFDGFDYSENEKKFLVQSLTSSGMPDDIREMTMQFSLNFDEKCRIMECPSSSYSSYK